MEFINTIYMMGGLFMYMYARQAKVYTRKSSQDVIREGSSSRTFALQQIM